MALGMVKVVRAACDTCQTSLEWQWGQLLTAAQGRRRDEMDSAEERTCLTRSKKRDRLGLWDRGRSSNKLGGGSRVNDSANVYAAVYGLMNL